ncbi:zinc-type alcohol dehydrogenase-like protein C1773.06c isoform X1 [Drosophila pseudoobscura]|uniref:Zinc-type alcohol dehydrogenase-like protein C1773.06c isoform X1 n=2 Tax=Drosophila pseudoobscura pseudoobscura TaxID=46245 RepID=A0A6I8UV76_DROPS|nr:zinc-type alcohol dehydrogenase-like protein C1773.06c isoform X1 [Drosophila pseudoobscura]
MPVDICSQPHTLLSTRSGTTDTSLSLNSLSLTSALPPTDTDLHHRPHNMNKLCRQVSIESPGPGAKNCVFNFFVPIEDTPALGARIRIVCAGACYRRRDRSNSITSMSSVSSELSDYCPSVNSMSPAHQGIREGSFFPGFEVAGVIEALGSEVTETNNCGLRIGQRVIVYPFDETPAGYAELLVVPDLKHIVPIPDSLPMEVAAMLPTGALLAMNAVFKAQAVVTQILAQRASSDPKKKCKILIVGTGGLALWAVRIASYHFALAGADNVDITVASLRDEGFRLATEIKNVSVVQWNECLYEPQLIERTKDVCGGAVDVVIDFGTTSRSLHRSMHCLSKGGVVLISDEVAEKLLPKFSRLSNEYQQEITPISNGTAEQLAELVELVATKKIEPPPHSVFPCEQAAEVIQKLCNSEIPGRAILRFHDIE